MHSFAHKSAKWTEGFSSSVYNFGLFSICSVEVCCALPPRTSRRLGVRDFVCYMLILSINYSYCQHNNSSDVNSDEQYTIRGEWQDTILYVARRSLIVVYVFLFFYCRRSFVMRNVATMLSYRIPAPSLKICTDKTGVSSLTFYVWVCVLVSIFVFDFLFCLIRFRCWLLVRRPSFLLCCVRFSLSLCPLARFSCRRRALFVFVTSSLFH